MGFLWILMDKLSWGHLISKPTHANLHCPGTSNSLEENKGGAKASEENWDNYYRNNPKFEHTV